jgi:hypothetical protein
MKSVRKQVYSHPKNQIHDQIRIQVENKVIRQVENKVFYEQVGEQVDPVDYQIWIQLQREMSRIKS